MPARCLSYDSNNINQQINDIKATMKDTPNPGRSTPSESEFLAGMYDDDLLLPVITLTLNLSTVQWNHPTNLLGIYRVHEKMVPLLGNWPVHLIDPSSMDDGEIAGFSTDLSVVLWYLKHYSECENLEELGTMLDEDGRFNDIRFDAAELMSVATVETKFKLPRRKGRVNMVKTIQDMLREDRARTGEEVKEKTAMETTLLHLSNVMSNLHMGAEEAMQALGIPEQDYPRYLDALRSAQEPA